ARDGLWARCARCYAAPLSRRGGVWGGGRSPGPLLLRIAEAGALNLVAPFESHQRIASQRVPGSAPAPHPRPAVCRHAHERPHYRTSPADSRVARPLPIRRDLLTPWMSAVPPGWTAMMPLRCCSSRKPSGDPHAVSVVSAAGPTASRIAPVIQSPLILRKYESCGPSYERGRRAYVSQKLRRPNSRWISP